MTIIRWTPARELATMQERMNRLFEDAMSVPRRAEDVAAPASFAPAVDIYETDREIVLKADLPGMQLKQIQIKVEDDVLSLSGERRLDAGVTEENYHRVERAYGAFSRGFSLPRTVDRDKIGASYKDGVLTVTLPKKEEVKPRQIKIDVAQ